MTFLTIDAVSKRYGATSALDEVTLHIQAGGRTAVVGPSGSGKTTLLRLLAGFDTPHSGRITMDGRLLADCASAIPAHQRDIGVVMQDGALFPHLSVADNIAFGLSGSTRHRTALVHELSDLVGLERFMLERRPDALSGGQQQRVALARALARRPKLMLLDEPFSALDTGLRANTRKAVADLLLAAGVTTVLVTHDQAEALSFADHVAVMDSGRILQAGPPRELYLRPKSAMIASFLGEALILPATLSDGKAHCLLGSMATHAPGRAGSVDIMLRPEQVSLSLQGPGVPCRITEVEFGGATSIITLVLAAGGNSPIILRQASDARMIAGADAWIVTSGCAHVLDTVDERRSPKEVDRMESPD